MSTGPLNPAVGVKLNVPFAFIVNVPCAEVGPLTTLAVKLAPAVLLSFVNTLPETAVPGAVYAKSSLAEVLGSAFAGVIV